LYLFDAVAHFVGLERDVPMTQNNRTNRHRLYLSAGVLTAVILASGCSADEADTIAQTEQPLKVAQRMANGDFPTGKTPADPDAQPWMVALVDANEADAQEGHFCGGSLIATNWVLTAAHCLEDMERTENIDVVIGRYQLSTDAGERIAAKAVYLHEGYADDEDGESNDIALIELMVPARVGAPIDLISRATAYTDDPGRVGRVTGWGILSQNSTSSTDLLHGVDLPIIKMADCEAADEDDALSRDDLCAGQRTGGKDSCSGDSGGPLTVTDRRGNPVQVGLVSFGLGECGEPNSYDVYIRLLDYTQWIADVKAGQEPETDLAEFAGGEEG